ncbi:hypothetical protein [Streptacidiphilus melanogenes]|uniref:hypothetical protein n=1 Tax=Streptacidiphilus melanogenes TaxID=411235 RepID=UPI0005A792C0|nr:hypothetical protein [Streptacidiphilus melanogenes]
MTPAISAAVLGSGPSPGELPAAVRAWRAAAGTGSTHHLVVRAPAAPVHRLVDELRRAVSRRPDAALAFGPEGQSWNGSALPLAALRGCAWAAAVPDRAVPTLALVLPSHRAAEFAEFAEDHRVAGTSYGQAVAAFAREHGVEVLVGVRGLLAPRRRRGACPRVAGTLRDEVCPPPGVLPRLLRGRAHVAVRDERDAVWRKVAWTDHLVRVGRNWPGVAPAAAFVAIADRPSPAPREAVLPLAEVVGYGIALGALLEQAPPERSARGVRGCLVEAVRAGAGPVSPGQWPETWTQELADVLWRAVGIGARLRSNHGVSDCSLEEIRQSPEVSAPGRSGDPHWLWESA